MGPLLFYIYINDLFYLVKDTEICNYADDTAIFVCGTELDPILKFLEKDASLLSGWFGNNYMKMNGDKSHLLVLGNKSVEGILTVSGYLIKESDEEKLLGVTIGKKLNFKSHVNSLCKKSKPEIACISTEKNCTGENRRKTVLVRKMFDQTRKYRTPSIKCFPKLEYLSLVEKHKYILTS